MEGFQIIKLSDYKYLDLCQKIFRLLGTKSIDGPPWKNMGRLVVHLHGKTKNKNLSNLIGEYQDRLASISLKILTYSDKLSALEFIKKIPDNGEKILLDEGGQEFDSVGFAKFVGSKQISSQDTHFLVGPAQGWDGVERDDYMRLSLSKMTMPHELASLVLIEQIYRATEINKGSNYHKF